MLPNFLYGLKKVRCPSTLYSCIATKGSIVAQIAEAQQGGVFREPVQLADL